MDQKTMLQISAILEYVDDENYDELVGEIKRIWPEFEDMPETIMKIWDIGQKYNKQKGWKCVRLGLMPDELERWFTEAKITDPDVIEKFLNAGITLEQVLLMREHVFDMWGSEFIVRTLNNAR
jgi:hypothetical protein